MYAHRRINGKRINLDIENIKSVKLVLDLFMARNIMKLVFEISGSSLRAFDTVITETPACSAISFSRIMRVTQSSLIFDEAFQKMNYLRAALVWLFCDFGES